MSGAPQLPQHSHASPPERGVILMRRQPHTASFTHRGKTSLYNHDSSISRVKNSTALPTAGSVIRSLLPWIRPLSSFVRCIAENL